MSTKDVNINSLNDLLDENLFSAGKNSAKNAKSKVSKNVKRSMDITKGINSRFNSITKKADRAIDKSTDKFNSKTDAIENPRVQLADKLKDAKKEYLKAMKNFIVYYENADGEDIDERLDDKNVRANLNYLKKSWKYMDDISNKYDSYVNAEKSDENVTESKEYLFEKINENWVTLHKRFLDFIKTGKDLDVLKGAFDDIAKKANKAFKTDFKLFNKEKSDKSSKDDSSSDDVFGINSDKKEKKKITPGRIADLLGDKDGLSKIISKLDLSSDEKSTLGMASSMFAESHVFDKLYKELSEEKSSEPLETIRRISKYYYTGKGTVGKVLRAREEKSGDVVSSLKKKLKEIDDEGLRKKYAKYVNGEFFKDEKKDDEEESSPDDLNQSSREHSEKSDSEKSDSEKSSEKEDSGKEKTQQIVKKKIDVLFDMYNKADSKEKFNQKVNQALRLIGLTNKKKYNATKILNWLKVAKNSMLKMESLQDSIELELHKEDIVDIMWENRFYLK